jgi:hypothetical protein
MGAVMVSTNGESERLFLQGVRGSVRVAWIDPDVTYDFHLDTMTTPPRRLASLRVETAAQPILVADPNPVRDGRYYGRTRIYWNTRNGSHGRVVVARSDGESRLLADGAFGTAEIDWIQPNDAYELRLYRAGDVAPGATLTVTRGPVRQPLAVVILALLLAGVPAWVLVAAIGERRQEGRAW